MEDLGRELTTNKAYATSDGFFHWIDPNLCKNDAKNAMSAQQKKSSRQQTND